MDDKRLERLYDYTKFHIGIYLSGAGGLAALISAAADSTKAEFVRSLIGAPWALGVAFVFLVLAGVSGAVVATSTIECESYSEFATSPQGAYGVKPFRGSMWVHIEHACFWVSLLLLAFGILSAHNVLKWLLPSGWVA